MINAQVHVCKPEQCPLQTKAAREACMFASHYGAGWVEEWHGNRGTYYDVATCYFGLCDCEWCEDHKNELLEIDNPKQLIAELKEQIALRNRKIRSLRRELRKRS